MRFNAPIVATALLATSGSAAVTPTKCNADNCLRALRATQIPDRVESARAFCASFTATSAANVPIPTYAQDGCKDNQNGDMKARLSSACACLPAASTTTSTVPSKTAEPCAEVSSSWASQVAQKVIPTVAASVAHKCLQSVPFNKKDAVAIIDAMEPYLEWQSDSAYLKNPPKGYLYPPYDIYAKYKEVRANTEAGKYSSHYEFHKDIQEKIFFPGHDGHFWMVADLMSVFNFRHPRGVVSFSEDGKSVPVMKLYEDVMTSPNTASVLKTINGVDAAKYVADLADSTSYSHDPDAAFNGMLYTSNLIGGRRGQFGTGGRYSAIYQGDNTTFAFANGTVFTAVNPARVVLDMTGVVDGASFYAKFAAPLTAGAANSVTARKVEKLAADKRAASARVEGYPEPVVSTKDGIVTGYFLEGDDVKDVAVLALRSFKPNSIPEFQAVVQDFIAAAKHANKKKIVIDLQGNGGGYILLGYELYRQFFPHVQEDGFSRWKDTKTYLGLSKAIESYADGFNPYTSDDSEKIDMYNSWFNWRFDLNTTHQPFTSFDDKFHPHVYENTPYTNLMAWDLNNTLLTKNETFGHGIWITGYGDLKNATQPFNAEDIILLYDGNCASTCTLTSEMFRINGGVKSVAFGGRPKAGPMQTIGAIKGSQVLGFGSIYSYAQFGKGLNKDAAAQQDFNRYKNVTLLRFEASVNTRDQILHDNLNDGVPAQFIYEPADCRHYWTLPMIKDVSETWKTAARSAFYGAKCNWGGLEHVQANAAFGETPESLAEPGPAPARLSETVDTKHNPVTEDPLWDARFNLEAQFE